MTLVDLLSPEQGRAYYAYLSERQGKDFILISIDGVTHHPNMFTIYRQEPLETSFKRISILTIIDSPAPPFANWSYLANVEDHRGSPALLSADLESVTYHSETYRAIPVEQLGQITVEP